MVGYKLSGFARRLYCGAKGIMCEVHTPRTAFFIFFERCAY
jgi:hypothetical protein